MIAIMQKILKIGRIVSSVLQHNHTYLSSEETFKLLRESRLSLIRFGDGEGALCVGRGIYYQEFDEQLQSRLIKILKEYRRSSPFMLAFPNEFVGRNMLNMTLRDIKIWSDIRYVVKKYVVKNNIFGDALMFRNYLISNEIESSEIIKLWEWAENIICVAGVVDYEYCRNIFLDKNVIYIKMPTENSFFSIDVVFLELKELFKNSTEMDSGNSAIIISAGPAAKILAYDLSNLGYCCYDVGFLLNPSPIREKYGIINYEG